MIDSKDLRKDNYVLYRGVAHKLNTKEIYELDFDLTNEVNYYKPIPLTEEWLLKFGFKTGVIAGQRYMKDELYEVEDGYIYVIDSNESKIGEWDYTEVEIKYVHQLQNLYFALCGEELKKD